MDGDRHAGLPDEIREDKGRIAQGFPPKHHRTKRHVRAAVEGWYRGRMFRELYEHEAKARVEESRSAYELDQAQRDFR